MNIRKHNYTNWFVRNLAAVISLTSVLLIPLTSNAQGIPFIRNFASDEYHANSTNFDIETDGSGNVFVANFEGLLYYDFAEWRIIHTPGITRTTVAFKASDNNIWVGGYNYYLSEVIVSSHPDIVV